jgi:hypothetical protein
VVSSFWLSHQYPICIPLLPHSCYMHRPSHPSWLDYSNYTWRRVQVMKLLLIYFHLKTTDVTGCYCWPYLDEWTLVFACSYEISHRK